MKRVLLLIVGIIALTLNSLFLNPISVEAKLTCKQVTTQTKKFFQGEYKGDPEKALVVFAQTLAKAYDLTLKNQSCFSKKEIAEMKKAIVELKVNCDKARQDKTAWLVQKDICSAYTPLYKWIK